MKFHTSKDGGESGWTRQPACRPLGHVINGSIGAGARYFVTLDAAAVTCKKCREILAAKK